MNILYTIGNGSKWNNNELRYSLRSICKYGQNVDKVVIVGTKPDFVNDQVIYIPCDDPYEVKHKNIFNKILTAAKSGLISEHFLISSDDHFYVKDTDFDNYPVYWKNEIIKGGDKNQYRRSLKQTKEFLEANGISLWQTNPHCNTHFDLNVYNKYKDLFDKGMELSEGLEANCLMGNLLIKEGWDKARYRDIKVRTLQDLNNRLLDSNCFSIYDSAIVCGVGDWLAERFPDKCKYEI